MKWLFSLLCIFSLHSKDLSYQSIEDKSDLKILTPSLKERETAKIRLDNGLSAYLISDPGADKSAAGMAVRAGQWNDPEAYPGMAHFTEHLLFLGTGAYPEEDGFMAYVGDNGGMTNAYTATDRTVYFFSVNNDAFGEALDQFSHFFIDPLFKPSGIGRELNAVDQENDKNVEHDGWRGWMVFKELGNPNHPNAKFSTGTAETLGKIPPGQVREFYEKNYGANHSYLVVYSNKPLPELVDMVVADFSSMPINPDKTPIIGGELTSNETKGHIVFLKPFADLKELGLVWQLPQEIAADREAKSAELIAYTLNSEHAMSLSEQLKREHLIEGMGASIDYLSEDEALFQIQFNLTDQGVKQYNAVLERTFQTLNLLKTEGIPKYVFDEMKQMKEINYQYQSRTNAMNFVASHAHNLPDEDLATYPRKLTLPSQYNGAQVHALLMGFSPAECGVTLTASPELTGVPPERREKWLGGEYSVRPIPNQDLVAWQKATPHDQIAMQEQNRFIPNRLELVEGTDEIAHLVSDAYGSVYYSAQSEYQVPEVVWLFGIKSPVINGKAENMALLDLYAYALDQKLAPVTTYASAAHLNVNGYASGLKFFLNVSGYSDKADVLLGDVLETLKSSKLSKDEFELYKDAVITQFENQSKMPPYIQSHVLLSNLLYNDQPTGQAKAVALKKVGYEDYQSFIKELFAKNYIEGMMTGNLTEETASRVWKKVHDSLSGQPYPKSEHVEKKVLQLAADKGPFAIVQESAMQGHVALMVIQEGTFSFGKEASQEVLGQALKEEFFKTLRTKQQTAYIAKSWPVEVEGELMQFFLVQSTTHRPQELIARFELFIENFIKDFDESMPEGRFENIRDGLVTTLETPPPNLFQMTSRLYRDAFVYNGDFDRVAEKINALKALTYEETLKDARKYLGRKNTRRLAILFEGVSPPGKDFQYHVTSPLEIKKESQYK